MNTHTTKQKNYSGWIKRLILRWLAIPKIPKLNATINCSEGDVLIFQFSRRCATVSRNERILGLLCKAFPKQKILMLPDDVSLQSAISQSAKGEIILPIEDLQDGRNSSPS